MRTMAAVPRLDSIGPVADNPGIEAPSFGERPAWSPARPRLGAARLIIVLLTVTFALFIAAWIVPGAHVTDFGGALVAAVVIATLNALLPPLVAALRLPLTLLLGFVLVLVLDALMLLAADAVTSGGFTMDSFWSALAVAFVASAVSVALDVLFGTDDDDTYAYQVIQRIARRSGDQTITDAPGIVFLEIDGLALPVLHHAMRDGSAPTMARWFVDGYYRLVEWETDLSSQTGASQAGILLGSNDDVPAFRWVEKETATLRACSGPEDCAEIERRLASGRGLLIDGGASRGNLLSGEADHMILTVSRLDAEKRANPGYRAFFANGFNVMRALVLFGWEVILEVSASSRAKRRDIRPRGHRGGIYPLLRATMCVIVRDLIVYGVLTDMMKGRPAVYATFSSYDEVAHHSGLERADTLEALRKLDQAFSRIERARRYAARPYEIVVLSDHGQTQGATFKQRNGYGLQELVERNLQHGSVTTSGRRRAERHGRPRALRGKWAEEEEAPEERRLRPGRDRARLRQSRARLPDGGTAAALARGDPGPAPPASRRAAWTPACRLAARPLRSSTGRSPSAHAARAISTRGGSRGRIRSHRSRRTSHSTSCEPTGSHTSRTSWSAASTTPRSNLAAPSRSSSPSTAASAARKRAPSCSSRTGCR